MDSRMGTRADVVFGSAAMTSILEAAERSTSPGGLTGAIETDDNGQYRRVDGIGRIEVGMYFPSEGTDMTDDILARFRGECGEGILVVIDPEIGELVMYISDSDGCRIASGLMSE